MDSKHRHELEENDLQQFLANFKQWFDKHGVKVLSVILLVLAVMLVVRFVRNQRDAALEAAWGNLVQTQTPEGFVELAGQSSDAAYQANARLMAADMLLNEVVLPDSKNLTTPEEPAPSTPLAELTPQQKLDVAAREYQAVLDGATEPRLVVYRLNALLGLAAVAEQRGELAEARKHYETVVAEATEQTLPAMAVQAKGKLARLDSLRQPVVMARDVPAEAAEQSPGLLGLPNLLGGDSEDGAEPGLAPSGLIPFDPVLPPVDAPVGEPTPEPAPAPAPEPAPAPATEDPLAP